MRMGWIKPLFVQSAWKSLLESINFLVLPTQEVERTRYSAVGLRGLLFQSSF